MAIYRIVQATLVLGAWASTDLRILDQYTSFLPDGSDTPGVGVYSVPLTTEYLGQDSPVDDYSLSLWWTEFCCPSFDANMMLSFPSPTKLTHTSALWSWVGTTFSTSTSLSLTADLSWHYVGMTHCISNRNLLLCHDGICSNSLYKTRNPLTSSMSLHLGKMRNSSVFKGRVGDIVLTINKCMSLSDFSARQSAKVPLGCSVVPAGGQFYDACDSNSAMLVQMALPGQSDLSVIAGAGGTVTDQKYFYGRTLGTSVIYFAGWSLGIPSVTINLKNQRIVQLGSTLYWTVPPAPSNTGGTFACAGSGYRYMVWELDSTGGPNLSVNFHCRLSSGLWSAPVTDNSVAFLISAIDTITVGGTNAYNYHVYTPGGLKLPNDVMSVLEPLNPPVSALLPNCVLTGTTCSSCVSGYFLSNYQCVKCHWACQTCTGPGYGACYTCNTGYYSLPTNPSVCLPQCPTGFTPTSNTCVQGSDIQLSVHFDNNLAGDITLPTGQRVQLGWDPNRFYPDFDFLDPIPVRYRGVFYNVSESISLPNFSGNNNHLVLNTDFTVDMWVLPYDYGSLFRVNTNNGFEDDDLLVFGITNPYINWPNPETHKVLTFGMKTYQQPFTIYETPLVLPTVKTEWYHLGFTCKYDHGTKTTTVTVFFNTQSYVLTFPSFFIDTAASRHNIGFLCRYIAGYLGYIYQLQVANIARTPTEIAAMRGKTCTGCSVCPAATDKCLSTCKYTEYVDENGLCKPCMKSCKYGCARPDSCNLCDDPLCSRCTTFDAGTCTLCYPGASFVNGKCKCDPGKYVMGERCSDQCDTGFYLDVVKSACTSCPNGCAECTATTCTACAADLFFENGECSCGEGWYVGDNSSCSRCDAVCKRCRGTHDACTECYTEYGYFLSGSECVDCRRAQGYIGGLGKPNIVTAGMSLEDTLNAVCQEKCGDGVVKGQLECDDGNNNDGDGCSATCTLEHGWECSNLPGQRSVCKDNNPPQAILTYSRVTASGYELVFSFTETVRFLEPVGDIASVGIRNVVLFSASFQAIEDPGDLYSPYLLTIEASESIKSGTRLTLTISDPSKVRDSSNNSLVTRKVSAILKDGFLTSTSQSVATAVAGIGGSVGGLAGIAIVTSAFGGANLGVLWMFLESLQIINYIVYMSVDFPDNLRTFLHYLQFANFNFVPNFFERYCEDTFEPPPKAFQAEDVSTDFFQNCGQIFTMYASLFLLYCIVRVLSRLFPLQKRLQKWKNSFHFSVPLRLAIESFLELSLAVFLQVREPIPGAPEGYASVVFAFLTLGYLTLTYFLTIGKVSLQSVTRLREKRHKRLYSTLYSEFRLDRRSTRSFLIFQNLRRLLFVLSLVFLTDSPVGQSALIALLAAAFAVTLAMLHPYRNLWLGNRVEIACEAILCIALCLVAGLNADMTRDARNALGWVIIATLSTIIGIHFVATIITQYRDVVKSVKNCGKRLVRRAIEKKKKVLGKRGEAQVWPFDDQRKDQQAGKQSVGKSYPELPMLPGTVPEQAKSASDSPNEEDSGEPRASDI